MCLFAGPPDAGADAGQARKVGRVKIIVGLGNPGARFRNTRHNLGFLVLDRLAESLGVEFTREKHDGLLAEAQCEGQKLLLVKPMTFMNCSGDCVAPVARNKISALSDILVVVDDVHLPLGKIRLRAEGSAGGHNGLKSIIDRVGGQGFARLRLGIGDDREGQGLADHVLSKFRPEEKPVVSEMVEQAVAAAECWIRSGIEQAMTRYN